MSAGVGFPRHQCVSDLDGVHEGCSAIAFRHVGGPAFAPVLLPHLEGVRRLVGRWAVALRPTGGCPGAAVRPTSVGLWALDMLARHSRPLGC